MEITTKSFSTKIDLNTKLTFKAECELSKYSQLCFDCYDAVTIFSDYISSIDIYGIAVGNCKKPLGIKINIKDNLVLDNPSDIEVSDITIEDIVNEFLVDDDEIEMEDEEDEFDDEDDDEDEYDEDEEYEGTDPAFEDEYDDEDEEEDDDTPEFENKRISVKKTPFGCFVRIKKPSKEGLTKEDLKDILDLYEKWANF